VLLRYYLWVNTWESAISTAAKLFLRPGDLAVDVGSNVGGVSANLSELVGSAGKVLAFEPNQTLNSSWHASMASSPYQHNATLENIAIWNSSDEFLTLTLDNSTYQSASSLKRDFVGDSSIEVLTKSLDDILETRIPDFIKIDVEGAEYEVLVGATKTITAHRPVIVFEMSIPLNVNEQSPLDFLSSLNYEFFHVNSLEKLNYETMLKEPGVFNVLAIHESKKIRVLRHRLWRLKKREKLESGHYIFEVQLHGDPNCQNGFGVYKRRTSSYEIFYMGPVSQLTHSTNSVFPILLSDQEAVEVRQMRDCGHSHIKDMRLYKLNVSILEAT
jgi:FkbM family methyltransferase